MTLYTVGHSNHPFEAFARLLREHGIGLVADVRSVPFSRRFPQFGRDRLRAGLADAGIDYAWWGDTLGGKPPDGADHATRARNPAFRAALARVLDEAARRPLALMCAERDPLDCHRAILLCRHLRADEPDIRHILADGSIEPHAAFETRLAGRRTATLLDPDPLESAYDTRARKMGGG